MHLPLHDTILDLAAAVGESPRIVHCVSRADQVLALLVDSTILAWPTPAGAESAARGNIVRTPLVDPQIRLETHAVARANDKSLLLSDYFRMLVKHVEEDRAPVQLPLPIATGVEKKPTRRPRISAALEFRQRKV